MGECDLIFLQAKAFESSGVSLDVHIRTKIRGDASTYSSVVCVFDTLS
jgi:hypothetical protein